MHPRAIQDVWILPGVFYGTTLRVYDPGLDAWHILWNDPVRQLYVRQIGRARGKDIVKEGKSDETRESRSLPGNLDRRAMLSYGLFRVTGRTPSAERAEPT